VSIPPKQNLTQFPMVGARGTSLRSQSKAMEELVDTIIIFWGTNSTDSMVSRNGPELASPI
jgi:hypothetical protein